MAIQTKTISFRVSEDAKSRLEARAKIENKTLSEYAKSILDNSESEKLIESVKTEFDLLESKIKKIELNADRLESDLIAISDRFKRSIDDHIASYEVGAKKMITSTMEFDALYKSALNSINSSRRNFSLTMIFSIVANLTTVSILLWLIFVR